VKNCRMGENYAFIKPNGDVERCCKDHSISLGNVVNGTFKLLEAPKECNVEDCYCWRRMKVGEEKQWHIYWIGTWDQFYANKIRDIAKKFYNESVDIDYAISYMDKTKEQIKNIALYKSSVDQVYHELLSFYLLSGYKYIDNNQFVEAEKFANELISKYSKYMINDTFLHTYIFLTRICMVSKNYLKAKEYVLLASKYNSKFASLYKLLAMIEFELKNYSKSKKLFVKAIYYAKKFHNNMELSEIYYEVVICLERYYEDNKININYNEILLKILKKSKKYNSNNITCLNKINELTK